MENSALDFSVSSLPSGVHYVDIQTSEGIYHKKFIKK
ncbi:MAG: T9SS type A sorting domain-containing protein [Bacteroidota bacterium]